VTAGPDLSGLAVATRGVTKRYGRQPALRGLDMSVPTGKVYGFLGPNGSGKTTTLRLLAGLITPDAGTMTMFGEPYTWRDRTRLFRVGSLIETPAFYPYLSGRENLIVIAATGVRTERSRVEEVLDYVGLQERANGELKTYSLGMKQRLGLAAAMLSDPDLLILDEPANGLDPAGMVALRETLRWVTGRGKTVLISSHLLDEIEQLADVVGIIDQGKLLREGPLDELLRDAGQVKVRVPVADMTRAADVLRRLAGDKQLYGTDSGPQAGWFQVGLDPARVGEVSKALAEAGIYPTGLQAGSDLETVFLQLTHAAAAAAALPPDMQPGGPPPPSPLPPPGSVPPA
jgi:ABC-2 type transport system ATP-binding protein